MSVRTLDPIPSSTRGRGFISVGELDLSLRERPSRANDDAGRRLSVRVHHSAPGPLDMSSVAGQHDGWLGLLILDGLLLAQLEEGRGHIGWLVGSNDLLRPWDMQEISLIRRATWRVLKPARIVLLDAEFGRQACGIPTVARELLSRSARTAHWLLAKSLIVSCPVLEDRLVLLFALLGERWGRVTADGILLDLPLTHGLLATLCGARRPSITLALHALQNDHALTRAASGGWLLHRVRPQRSEGSHSCWQSYADALGLAPASTTDRVSE